MEPCTKKLVRAASDWFNYPDTYCRKCNAKNSAAFLAPVFVEGIDARTGQKHPTGVGTHICLDCATKQNWIDARTGNLRPGVTL